MALTAKEKKFIDEVVYLQFNGEELFKWELTRLAAIHAEYEISENNHKAQEESKKIFNDSQAMQDYYKEQWEKFNNALQNDKRDIWNEIYNLVNPT